MEGEQCKVSWFWVGVKGFGRLSVGWSGKGFGFRVQGLATNACGLGIEPSARLFCAIRD